MEKNIKKECLCVTESLCCTVEVDTTLWINCTLIKKKLINIKFQIVPPKQSRIKVRDGGEILYGEK